MPLPDHAIAEVQRILDEAARQALNHELNCADEHGQYHYTPAPRVPGEGTCNVCGKAFVLEFSP